MTSKEKFLIPLTATAAVVGIWAAFRKAPAAGATPATAMAGGGAVIYPLPGMQEASAQYGDHLPAGSPYPGQVASSTDPAYIDLASTYPLAYDPVTGAAIPGMGYLNYNISPWNDLQKYPQLPVAGLTPPGGGSGGCGCGGCGGCGGGCAGAGAGALTASLPGVPQWMVGNLAALAAQPGAWNALTSSQGAA